MPTVPEFAAKAAEARSRLREAVRVTAPARLHLGFLDLNGNLGRRFASVGMAIDQPATQLTLSHAGTDTDSVTGLEAARARKALSRFKAELGLATGYRLDVQRAIPAHAGLGSGTQLAMAVGGALARLDGLETEMRALGELQNRGARSAIGLNSFERGGFVVDGGRGGQDHAPPVLSRLAFPAAWRVLLVMDPKRTGVHGDTERRAFEELAPMGEAVSAELCRVTVMRLLPALAEGDLEAFGEAVSLIQRRNGEYFSDAQGGGIWSSPRVEAVVRRLADLGAVGIGQSSWGPTGFAFVASPAKAAELRQAVAAEVTAAGLEIAITRGRNQGALIETIDASDAAVLSATN